MNDYYSTKLLEQLGCHLGVVISLGEAVKNLT